MMAIMLSRLDGDTGKSTSLPDTTSFEGAAELLPNCPEKSGSREFCMLIHSGNVYHLFIQ